MGPDSRFLPIAWAGFLSPLPPLLRAVWGSGTSISGEKFDGISMGFSVPVAQQRGLPEAPFGVRWLWAPGVGDGGSVTPLGWPFSTCWRGALTLLPPGVCLSNQGELAAAGFGKCHDFPSWVSCCTVVVWEFPLTVLGQGLRLARLIGQ